MPIQQHPNYAEGFNDAARGEPIFEGECSPEYEAGWRAYWDFISLLDKTNI